MKSGRTWWVGTWAVVLLAGLMPAAIIEVENPGDNQDIQPALQAAVDAAADGDTVRLPAGVFVLDRRVNVTRFVSIQGRGCGAGGTRLYRRADVADEVLEGTGWTFMLFYNIASSASSGIVVSDIWFQSKAPDTLSLANDYAIFMRNAVDFVVVNNRFDYFGDGAVRVEHRDTLASGLICDNRFMNNYKRVGSARTLGYGVVTHGTQAQWVAEPRFGSGNFIFIEDNYFEGHRHAITAGGCALYVARHNEIIDNFYGQAIDAHGGGAWSNTFSTRAYEIYHNIVNNVNKSPAFASGYVHHAVSFRGGEGLLHHNTISGYFGYGLQVRTEVFEGEYPVNTQLGYASGLELGSAHRGGAMPYGDGDAFIWDNVFLPNHDETGNLLINEGTAYLTEGRDYHVGVAKPGYATYTYPHPLRSLYAGGSPQLALAAPNGMESWALGSSRAITWTATAFTGQVRLVLYSGNSKVGAIATGLSAGAGTYSWTVGQHAGGTAPVGASYRVRVVSNDGTLDDWSDAAFAITAPPSLRLLSPNGGESWAIGSARAVTWTATAYTGQVRLVLYSGNTKVGAIATGLSAAAGSFNWTVGQHAGGMAPAGANYRVRVISNDGALSDWSDATFALAAPTLRLTSPNGGEGWTIGSARAVTWVATGYTGLVRLVLYNGSAKVGAIATGVSAGAGTFSWIAGRHSDGTAPAGANYRVRVISNDGALSDWSDAAFSLSD